MSLKIAILMDPIAAINIKKDSSFAMLLEAQSRNHQLHYLEHADLHLVNNQVTVHSKQLTVFNNSEKWFSLGETVDRPVDDFDVILMRKDPPFDMEFIYSTYLLLIL